MLNAAIYIVFALLLIVCSLLLLVVLMQRPKQEGLGAAFGAQMTDQAFGAQTTDVLKKGTILFGSLFMGLCFILAVLMNARFQASKSDLGQKVVQAPVEAPKAETATETPAAPATPSVDNLENLVGSVAEPAPAPVAEEPAPAAEPAPAPVAEEPAPAAESAPVPEA